MTTIDLGFAASDTATSPTTTYTGLNAFTVSLVPERPAKPYQYLDGTTVERGGALVYAITFDLDPRPYAFDAAGVANTHALHLWWQNQPKFMRSTTSNWTDIFGSGWVKVTGEGKMEIQKAYGREYYKFTVKAALPVALS